MRSSSRWAGRRAGLWGLGLLALVGAASTLTLWADSQENFREGVQAASRGSWSEVANRMEAAIREKPQETRQTQRIEGMRFEPYFPHYYLGVALQELGDCAGAIEAWNESLRQGAISGAQLLDMNRRRKQCPELSPLPPPAAPPIDPEPEEPRERIDERPAQRETERRQTEIREPPLVEEVSPKVPTEPPVPLRQAARAFFAGSYGETLEILGEAQLAAPRELATARLLSAAARFSLFVAGGREDPELERQALADIGACRALDPRVVPDPLLFSPPFVELFRQQR